MADEKRTLIPFYQGWGRDNALLIGAIKPLSPEQLAASVAPSQRPAWLIAAHIVATRVGWFHGLMGQGNPTLLALDLWDMEDAPPRTAPELVDGLEVTWHMIEGALARWTPADLNDTFTLRDGATVTREWVIWHVIEHDLSHGGELYLTLGAHGLATPDL